MQANIIMHIDVNSAYLSWEAVNALKKGSKIDLRTIPSVVGGDESKRHGIVLAKSVPAKKFKIKTGETLYSARQKCPNLTVVSPTYPLYIEQSNALKTLLLTYTPTIERFSIDEYFADFSGFERQYGDAMQFAENLKNIIYQKLGFTVNIGVSTNKLLAKMAGDFEKPNKIHSLFPSEIENKLWHLPIENLFMLGRQTAPKMRAIGINTIGDLANADSDLIKLKFQKQGVILQNYANGKGNNLKSFKNSKQKGIGNSTTIAFDVKDKNTAYMIILSLTEMVAYRLRKSNKLCQLISISLKDNKFNSYSHQKKLDSSTDNTNVIYQQAKILFDQSWKRVPLRQIGVRVGKLISANYQQLSMLENIQQDKQKLDQTLDQIRNRYGQNAIMRASFVNTEIDPIKGGTNNIGDYPMAKSQI